MDTFKEYWEKYLGSREAKLTALEIVLGVLIIAGVIDIESMGVVQGILASATDDAVLLTDGVNELTGGALIAKAIAFFNISRGLAKDEPRR